MAIEKKLICFARLEEFQRQLAAGNILDYSIVFIQDAKKIWTRGTYYDCNSDIKQDTLVSGTNIKTINGESIIGSGDIVIEGGETLTESDIAAMGFTKNTGTYSKPSGGIPKTDLASAVQTSLGKADTALQSYTEQYKGTVTGVKINGTTKNPSNGVVDLGTVITSHQTLKTINGESIVGSGNIKISGGSSSGKEVITQTSGFISLMLPNKIYIISTPVDTLDIVAFYPTTNEIYEEYFLCFYYMSSPVGSSFSLPSEVVWANGEIPALENGVYYELSITKTTIGGSDKFKAVLVPFKSV